MNLFVVGTREDVAGFALAGIRGAVCTTREEAAKVIARAEADALLLVSSKFASELPRERLGVALPEKS